MSAIQDAEKILIIFGKEVADDLKTSLNAALKAAGNKNPQEAALTFTPEFYDDPDGISMAIVASGEYWKWIESGRKKGARRIPADVVGKKWQAANGIDARQVILTLRTKNKKKGLNYKQPKFSKKQKSVLNYDKAAKSLSFIIQNSIYKKGIKPKHFVDRVLNDGRLDKLRNQLTDVLADGFKLEILQ
jgi:hypothetical protein